SNLSTFSLFGLDSVSFITLKFNFISTERFSVVWRATEKVFAKGGLELDDKFNSAQPKRMLFPYC
ncbi:hypothetical protein, partial [Riemerella anatipestifer]|uniref:hypothetical protein n=1 Tax=Riemerella anatipestifer TaxID=34085 RepID=UPI00210927C3